MTELKMFWFKMHQMYEATGLTICTSTIQKQIISSEVIGFEEIKNPTYNAKYNIIESYIVSGEDWLFFYGIRKNKVFDYKIRVKDDHGKNFDKEYIKAIKEIAAKK